MVIYFYKGLTPSAFANKTLILSSNSDNGTNASLAYFNSNNVVSNTNTNVSSKFIILE